MMEAVFLKILNMGLTASWIVLAVILVRLLLKKAPKWIAVLMWGLVAIRLVCPIPVESALSLVPSAEPVPSSILAPPSHSGESTFRPSPGAEPAPSGIPTPPSHSEDVGTAPANDPAVSVSPAPAGDGDPAQAVIRAASILWLVGMTGMLLYTAVSYLKIRKKVREAIPSQENIWLCDRVDTPFILGVVRPRIFLPSAMQKQDLKYVIAHEQAHLKRHDHWWKPLGFLLLTVYWFNPLLWIAYMLLCRDIELACDEKVIREMGAENKKPYSDALISCSVPRKMIAACPLAFGEGSVKGRVKSVLNYKKPGLWVLIAAVISCVAVAVCFLPNPAQADGGQDMPTKPNGQGGTLSPATSAEDEDPLAGYYNLDASNGLDVYVWQMAEYCYDFGVLPHSDTPRDWLSGELMDLLGADVDEMRQILASYGLEEKDIYVIPWQNPYSSYIPATWRYTDGKLEASMEDYIAFVRELLLSDDLQRLDPIQDSMTFDMDGDGKDEECTLYVEQPLGMQTPGIYRLAFSAKEVGAQWMEGFETYWTEWYDLSFVKCDDGVVRVQAIDHEGQPQTHLFDIVIINTRVHFRENGEEIGTRFLPE